MKFSMCDFHLIPRPYVIKNIVNFEEWALSPLPPIFHGFWFEPSFMTRGLKVDWRDVKDGCGSGFSFSKFGTRDSYDLYQPLKILVCKVPIHTYTKPEVKGESRKRGYQVLGRGSSPSSPSGDVGDGAPQNGGCSSVPIKDKCRRIWKCPAFLLQIMLLHIKLYKTFRLPSLTSESLFWSSSATAQRGCEQTAFRRQYFVRQVLEIPTLSATGCYL